MALDTPLRLVIVAIVSACLGWGLFVVSFHDLEHEARAASPVAAAPAAVGKVTAAEIGKPVTRRLKRRPFRSPAPVVKPQGRVAYIDWLNDGFNLRQCQCLREWNKQPADVSVCRCSNECPPFVDPGFLTEAKGQALCSLEQPAGFNCYAECEGPASPNIKWFATPCGGDTKVECEPAVSAAKREKAMADALKAGGRGKGAAVAAAASAEHAAAAAAKEQEEAVARKKREEEEAAARRREEAEAEEKAAAKASKEGKGGGASYDPKESLDLRGLQCELLDGQERCFLEDEQGRELCPPHVTSEYLASPSDQYLCSAAMAHQYYCTAGCQEGSDEVRWGAHEIEWCNANKGSCPPRTPPIPRKDFKLVPWSAKPEPVTRCRAAWDAGERPSQPIPRLSVGMLTHEPRSFRDSLLSYEKWGLFSVVSEFMIYINKRRPEVDAVAQEFAAKFPVIRIMGDEANHGIARGMSYLTGNASQPYFLFLERDFHLIEPATCVVEQLVGGMKTIEAGAAHVVRFRHRRHPGRPNWAARMYMGREDDVFKSGQPNLFCNHFYWYNEPEKRWPDKIWKCAEDPEMLCSDSYYCNWTNNPQIWRVDWWNKEYVEKFDNFKQNDPYYDLEMYMNWEPNSWNDRKWIVAQGEGLFKHVDRGNFGII